MVLHPMDHKFQFFFCLRGLPGPFCSLTHPTKHGAVSQWGGGRDAIIPAHPGQPQPPVFRQGGIWRVPNPTVSPPTGNLQICGCCSRAASSSAPRITPPKKGSGCHRGPCQPILFKEIKKKKSFFPLFSCLDVTDEHQSQGKRGPHNPTALLTADPIAVFLPDSSGFNSPRM